MESNFGLNAQKLLGAPHLQEKLKRLKLLILDVDGIMTSGHIFWLEGHGWTRQFHIRDGYGLKILMKAGIQVAIISGGDSKDVRTRMEFLKISHIFLGDEDKVKALEKIKASTGFEYSEMAFMGDDLFDIPVLEKVGFSATVPQAVSEVLGRVDYVTQHHAGAGAVREIADAIRRAQGLGPHF